MKFIAVGFLLALLLPVRGASQPVDHVRCEGSTPRPAEEERIQAIRGKNHKMIGYLEPRGDRTFVRDVHHTLLGWTDSHGTYDRFGRKLLDSPVPTALLPIPK